MLSCFLLYTYAANKCSLRYHSTDDNYVPPLVTTVASVAEAPRPIYSF